MNQNRVKAIGFSSLIGICVSLGASADEIDTIYRSAHLLGRGNAGLATIDNHEAILINPAGLAIGKGVYKETVFVSPTIEVSENTKDLAKKIGIQKKSDPETLRQHLGKNQHVGISNFTGVVLRRAAIGALMSTQSNIIVAKSADQSGLEEVAAESATNQLLTFSMAENFWKDRLLVGATAKYIVRAIGKIKLSILDAQNIGETFDQENVIGTGRGGGADLGLMYRGKGRAPFSFGLTLENVGDTQIVPDKASDVIKDLKQTINVGVAYEPGTRFTKFKLFLDIRDLDKKVEKNLRKSTHAGLEITFRSAAGLSAGMNQGYSTVGLHVDLYLFRVDLGMYTQETGTRAGSRPDQRFYFRLIAKL